MKRTAIIFFAALPFCTAANAQRDSLQLKETVITGAKTTTLADRTVIRPTAETLHAATSVYNLLARLALPGIRVDEISHAITSAQNDGTVQLRINGIIVDKAEMMSLETSAVLSVEYIDNPGVRYGDGIAKVINIKTRRATGGYVFGADLSSSPTTRVGNNAAFARLNRGKNEVTASYSNSYTDVTDFHTERPPTTCWRTAP